MKLTASDRELLHYAADYIMAHYLYRHGESYDLDAWLLGYSPNGRSYSGAIELAKRILEQQELRNEKMSPDTVLNCLFKVIYAQP